VCADRRLGFGRCHGPRLRPLGGKISDRESLSRTLAATRRPEGPSLTGSRGRKKRLSKRSTANCGGFLRADPAPGAPPVDATASRVRRASALSGRCRSRRTGAAGGRAYRGAGRVFARPRCRRTNQSRRAAQRVISHIITMYISQSSFVPAPAQPWGSKPPRNPLKSSLSGKSAPAAALATRGRAPLPSASRASIPLAHSLTPARFGE
jgi:hypothetical protein